MEKVTADAGELALASVLQAAASSKKGEESFMAQLY